LDNKTFRNAMGKFTTGVTVITTKVNEDIHGMTANAFMSVSLNPKLVTISIDNQAKMIDKIKTSGKYAVSFLSDEQVDVSMHFAGQKKLEGRFEFDYLLDLPVIPNALASVVCNVYEAHVVGDHTLFVGEVLDIVVRDGNPLTFFGGKYGQNLQIEFVNN
jgi:flavin reductase (DIM6/NTAB) family NADH-FMN oxidoreductase RutF